MPRKFLIVFCGLILSACSVVPSPTQEITATPASVEATATVFTLPTEAVVPTETAIPTEAATATLEPTQTPTATVAPSSTPTVTVTPTDSPKVYVVQPNTPVLGQNFGHADLACNWTGVAGQVFGKDGKPVDNLVVVVDGVWNASPVELLGMTGTAKAYGAGGYEIKIADKPADTKGTLYIQVFDLNGVALTDHVAFNTSSNCTGNLTLINFVLK
jgi:hypothetical protein